MLDFIEPSIEKRIEVITQENEEKLQEQYTEFDAILTSIKSYLPVHLRDVTEKLETMYIKRTDDLAPVYRTGFDDAIKLVQFFQNVSSDDYRISHF